MNDQKCLMCGGRVPEGMACKMPCSGGSWPKKSLFDGLPGGKDNPHYKAELAELEAMVGAGDEEGAKLLSTKVSEVLWQNGYDEDADGVAHILDGVMEPILAKHRQQAVASATAELVEDLEWLKPYAEVQVKYHPDATDTPNWVKLIAALSAQRKGDKSDG